jgi:hypothetical protein
MRIVQDGRSKYRRAGISPLGTCFPTGKIDETITFDSTDVRASLPRCIAYPAT